MTVDWSISPELLWALLVFLALLVAAGIGIAVTEFLDHHHIEWIDRRSH